MLVWGTQERVWGEEACCHDFCLPDALFLNQRWLCWGSPGLSRGQCWAWDEAEGFPRTRLIHKPHLAAWPSSDREQGASNTLPSSHEHASDSGGSGIHAWKHPLSWLTHPATGRVPLLMG